MSGALLPGQKNWLMFGLYLTADEEFESEAAARKAWKIHRDRILLEYTQHNPAQRPYAFWEYDQQQKVPDHFLNEMRLLHEMGYLLDREIVHWQKMEALFESSPDEETINEEI
jgi:hypothetical protein